MYLLKFEIMALQELISEGLPDMEIQKLSDANLSLAAGEQPVNQVLSDLNKLEGGSIYKLTAPFLPAPLIEKASSPGLTHWLIKEKEDRFIVYFFRNTARE